MTGKQNDLLGPKREATVFVCYVECMADFVYRCSEVASVANHGCDVYHFKSNLACSFFLSIHLGSQPCAVRRL